MMIRFVLNRYAYDYSKKAIFNNAEQSIIDVPIPEAVENAIKDGFSLERVGLIQDASNIPTGIYS